VTWLRDGWAAPARVTPAIDAPAEARRAA
jgi:hypothetical protein